MRTALTCAVVPLAMLVACDDVFNFNKSHGSSDSISADFCGMEEIFDGQCVSCHSPGSGNLGGLDLETDPYGALVGVASAADGSPLVTPGDRDASLLYLKCGGTQDSATQGGSMPLGSTLSADALDAMGTWIDEGAEPCDGGDTNEEVGDDWCYVADLIAGNCLGCHDTAGASSAADLNLETDPYNALYGVFSSQWPEEVLVVSGDSPSSLLWRKLAGEQGDLGARMPMGRQLTQAQIDGVAAWIDAGAASADCN